MSDRQESGSLAPDNGILPPYSERAEMGALGCVGHAPEASMEEMVKMGVGADWFYDIRHRALYGVFAGMFEDRIAIDPLTLHSRLTDKRQMEAVGGLSYYSSLPDAAPSAANLPYYLDILGVKFAARQLLKLAGKLTSDVQECVDIKALTASAYQQFDEIARACVLKDKARAKPIREILETAIDRYERLKAGERRGVPTGFIPIDCLGGLIPGEMVIIAGETKIGKSTLALNFLHGAIKGGVKAAVFSLEMSDQAWIDRLLSLELEIDRRAFRTASYMNDGVMHKLVDNMGRMKKLPLWICDDAAITTPEMDRTITKLVLSEGIGMFVVDYAQIVAPSNDGDSRELQVAKIGRDIRRICQQHGLVALVLSQLNDDGKIRESRALLHECHMGFVLEERKDGLWVRQAAGRDVDVQDFPVEFDGVHCRIKQRSQMGKNPHND